MWDMLSAQSHIGWEHIRFTVNRSYFLVGIGRGYSKSGPCLIPNAQNTPSSGGYFTWGFWPQTILHFAAGFTLVVGKSGHRSPSPKPKVASWKVLILLICFFLVFVVYTATVDTGGNKPTNGSFFIWADKVVLIPVRQVRGAAIVMVQCIFLGKFVLPQCIVLSYPCWLLIMTLMGSEKTKSVL